MLTPGTNGSISNSSSPKSNEVKEFNHHLKQTTGQTLTATATTKPYQNGKRQRLHNQQLKQRQQSLKKPKQNQIASPPQDQVSSTQDQVGPALDDHDCQTSPLMLVTTQVNDYNPIQIVHDDDKQLQDSPPMDGHKDRRNFPAQTQSSPSINYASTTTTSTTTTTTNTSPSQTENIDGILFRNSSSSSSKSSSIGSSSSSSNSINISGNICNDGDGKRKSDENNQIDIRNKVDVRKKKKIHHNSDHDTSSTASWSSSYTSPPSPISTSSDSSVSSTSSRGSSSACSSSLSPSLSPSPSSSPDLMNELRGPRLKLSEGKLRKIKKRPILFDDYYTEHSFASTPTTSSGCSPGQHSNTTQNSDQSRSGLLTNNAVIHIFQAPPKFVSYLKPCNLPKKQEPSPTTVAIKEMLNCAICGIKEMPKNISKKYGQNSCPDCTKFFEAFLKKPETLYCHHDGDCLMTCDSRCHACWIKICLQKFNIEERYRHIRQEYSPKLESSQNVSLITIDTSLSR